MLKFEEHFFVDQSLKDIPKNPHNVLNRINSIQNEMSDDDSLESRVKHLGELGFLNRTLGNLDLAEQYLGEAMELIEEGDLGPRFYVICGTRLAHVWQWQKRFEESNPMLLGIIELCESSPACKDLLDFSFQHMGKNLFDQEKYSSALEYFERALDLRMIKNDLSLISSTETAIEITKNRMNVGCDL